MLDFLVGLQTTIHGALSDDISAFSITRNWWALLAVLPLGVVFGGLHALTPGHSKAILASYVVGSGMPPKRALLTAFALSLTHIGAAVLLALVGSSLITRTIVGAGQVPALEWTSRLMMVAIGVWLLVRAVWHRPHVHGEGTAFGFLAGLVPCPLTLFIMFFAVSKGVPEAGLIFSVAMLIGVGSILVAVALLSAFAGRFFQHLLVHHGVSLDRFSRGLNAFSGLLLISLALTELAA